MVTSFSKFWYTKYPGHSKLYEQGDLQLEEFSKYQTITDIGIILNNPGT